MGSDFSSFFRPEQILTDLAGGKIDPVCANLVRFRVVTLEDPATAADKDAATNKNRDIYKKLKRVSELVTAKSADLTAQRAKAIAESGGRGLLPPMPQYPNVEHMTSSGERVPIVDGPPDKIVLSFCCHHESDFYRKCLTCCLRHLWHEDNALVPHRACSHLAVGNADRYMDRASLEGKQLPQCTDDCTARTLGLHSCNCAFERDFRHELYRIGEIDTNMQDVEGVARDEHEAQKQLEQQEYAKPENKNESRRRFEQRHQRGWATLQKDIASRVLPQVLPDDAGGGVIGMTAQRVRINCPPLRLADLERAVKLIRDLAPHFHGRPDLRPQFASTESWLAACLRYLGSVILGAQKGRQHDDLSQSTDLLKTDAKYFCILAFDMLHYWCCGDASRLMKFQHRDDPLGRWMHILPGQTSTNVCVQVFSRDGTLLRERVLSIGAFLHACNTDKLKGSEQLWRIVRGGNSSDKESLKSEVRCRCRGGLVAAEEWARTGPADSNSEGCTNDESSKIAAHVWHICFGPDILMLLVTCCRCNQTSNTPRISFFDPRSARKNSGNDNDDDDDDNGMNPDAVVRVEDIGQRLGQPGLISFQRDMETALRGLGFHLDKTPFKDRKLSGFRDAENVGAPAAAAAARPDIGAAPAPAPAPANERERLVAVARRHSWSEKVLASKLGYSSPRSPGEAKTRVDNFVAGTGTEIERRLGLLNEALRDAGIKYE